MAWNNEGDALLNKAASGVPVSSTSVVLTTGTATSTGAGSGLWSVVPASFQVTEALWMFGVSAADLGPPGDIPEVTVGAGSVWTQADLDPDPGYISYLKSSPLSGGAPADFDTTKAWLTAVPASKASRSWAYEQVVQVAGVYQVDPTATADFDVRYGDVSVVALPDGWWLMLMSRKRSDMGTGGLPLPRNQEISDIVGWVSPDLSFAGERVVGPLLVVSSLDAVEAESTLGFPVRLWLSVPGGVVNPQGTELLVYYTAEAGTSDDGMFPPAFDQYIGNAYAEHLSTIQFERGNHLKRILLADLLARVESELSSPGTWTDEGAVSAFGREAAVPGTLAGRLRVMVGQSCGDWQSFEDFFAGSTEEATPWVADPQPVVARSGNLVLYFAAVLAEGATDEVIGPGSGHGIWRASEVEGSEGQVFFIRTTRDGEPLTSDQVIADSEDSVYLDPCPCQLSDGTWVVFVGQVDPSTAADLPMQRIVGTSLDGDRGSLSLPCGVERWWFTIPDAVGPGVLIPIRVGFEHTMYDSVGDWTGLRTASWPLQGVSRTSWAWRPGW